MEVDETPVLVKEPAGGVPEVIETVADFTAAIDLLSSGTGPIAADAERASGYRYGHEDWLIQVKRAGAGIFLFDPITLGERGADLADLTTGMPDEEWILHDASQDLPGFADVGITPVSLFDTEHTARLLNLPHVGLAAVTEYFLGKSLAKEHSAADWSYRPLPRDWRNYAALDVELLIGLREKMSAALKKSGKDEWARQDFAAILRYGLTPKAAVEEPWRHMSKITTLKADRRGLAIVRELWTVRDTYARELDIAPSLLLSDATIIEVAQRKPHNTSSMRSIRGLNQRVRIMTGTEQDKMFARYAPLQRKVPRSVWRQAIIRALEMDTEDLPAPTARKLQEGTSAPRSMRYWREHQPDRYARLQASRKRIEDIAHLVNVPTELVLKPSILRALCWQEVGAEQLMQFLEASGARPWQRELVAESLSRVIM